MFLSYTITGTLRSTALHKKDVAHTAAGMFSLLPWYEAEADNPEGVYVILVVTLPTVSPVGGCCAVSVVRFLRPALAFFLFLGTSVDGK